eukprot:gene26692-24757_t
MRITCILLLGFATSAQPKKTLDVFLVPHTHADTGWMLTIQQYYEQLVEPILTSTLSALAADPSRRYIWAEVAYFAMWWERQSPSSQNSVRKLARSGGWCQADELVADLDGRAENLAVGHAWLRENV